MKVKYLGKVWDVANTVFNKVSGLKFYKVVRGGYSVTVQDKYCKEITDDDS